MSNLLLAIERIASLLFEQDLLLDAFSGSVASPAYQVDSSRLLFPRRFENLLD
jgi:hypothetical protein